MEQPVNPLWRKASYSGNGGGSCVEVGTASSAVLIRDTTNRKGLTLPVTPGAWNGFLTGIRGGDYNAIG